MTNTQLKRQVELLQGRTNMTNAEILAECGKLRGASQIGLRTMDEAGLQIALGVLNVRGSVAYAIAWRQGWDAGLGSV